ncbi:MAG TPA: 50S ribosomal protein L9 [Caldithrix abyssi]|uniref:Large ribosomal subunit protein bL9 n=1 Tax=Caldithrix abyssi TaxID=187145 RepID=A0A7V1LK95_CALAY|nr:50S ribosomal protein L9 [Caldithrix abyssi]
MNVLLRQDYEGLGEAGQEVKVKDGFARNFLIPQGIAFLANKQNRKRFENDQKQKSWKQEKEKHAAEELAKKLENVSCTISVQVGEEDKLFGSVTSQNIADSLKEQGFEIEKRKILLDEPIKALGIYTVNVKLHSDVEGSVKVWVVKE